jgi:hypothetical protein
MAIKPFSEFLVPSRTGVLLYYDDPAGFVRDCFKWPQGKGPTKYQESVMRALVKHHRVAVRGPRGLGKTTTHAWIILWFALTRDAAGEDWKIVVTASAWRQLTDYLWPEVEMKWVPKINWDVVGRKPFGQLEMMRRELRLTYGAATTAACTDPTKIEGAHADQLLYVFDEAKAIPDATWDSAEGAFSGAGRETDAEAYAIASSTPGAPEGRFYDIHVRKPGLDEWFAIHVTLDQVLRAKRLAREWVARRREQYGEMSTWFQNHVKGEFAAEEEDGVIWLSRLEEAHERWRELGIGQPSIKSLEVPRVTVGGEDIPLQAIGVDIARSGKDKTVYAMRHGNVISRLIWRDRSEDTMVTANEVKGLLDSTEHHPTAVVDANGLGVGVFDRLREMGANVRAFISQEKTEMRDRASVMGFDDTRAAALWNLREMLEPNSGFNIAIPPDDQLTADLLAPHWKVATSGKIRVESKDDIRKRLKRSTDAGDAVVQAFWTHRSGHAVYAPQFADDLGGSRWAALRPDQIGGGKEPYGIFGASLS